MHVLCDNSWDETRYFASVVFGTEYPYTTRYHIHRAKTIDEIMTSLHWLECNPLARFHAICFQAHEAAFPEVAIWTIERGQVSWLGRKYGVYEFALTELLLAHF